MKEGTRGGEEGRGGDEGGEERREGEKKRKKEEETKTAFNQLLSQCFYFTSLHPVG